MTILDHTANSRRDAALAAYSAAMSRAVLAQARAHENKTAAAWRAYRAHGGIGRGIENTAKGNRTMRTPIDLNAALSAELDRAARVAIDAAIAASYSSGNATPEPAWYMHPATGSIDTLDGWYPHGPDDGLVQVVFNAAGEWVPA